METKERLHIKKDLANKQIIITRLFDATPDVVWSAWTEPEYLNQWWAPEPWHAETKKWIFVRVEAGRMPWLVPKGKNTGPL